MSPVVFTADHHGFYKDGQPFYPSVSNVVSIRFPAGLREDLDFSKEIAIAQDAVAEGKFLFCEIDLGLPSFVFNKEDSANFFSFSIALQEFSKQVWPLFEGHIFGVGIYRGSFNPMEQFPFFVWESHFLEWKEETQADYELYCAQLFAEYLHRLVSFLPESALPFALIDISTIFSAAKQCQLFSRERFEHVHLGFKGSRVSFSGIVWEGQTIASQMTSLPSLGLCLPKDSHMDPPTIDALDRWIVSLQQKELPFRLIPEEKLTEEWDGLDELIVIRGALSAQGKRKLQGFVAAGGTVTSV